MPAKLVADAKLDAWMRGWKDGASGKAGRSSRYHADEYERGYNLGRGALGDHLPIAKRRIEASK